MSAIVELVIHVIMDVIFSYPRALVIASAAALAALLAGATWGVVIGCAVVGWGATAAHDYWREP